MGRSHAMQWNHKENTVVRRSQTRLSSETCIKQLLFEMHHSFFHDKFTRMVVTLWAIWTARRKTIYESIFQSPQVTNQFVLSYISDLQIFVKPRASVAWPMCNTIAQWKAPPNGCQKSMLMVRCRVMSVERLVQYVKIRMGYILEICSFHPRSNRPRFAGSPCMWGSAASWGRIHVSSDCKIVVDKIKGRSSGRYGAIIKEIQTWTSNFESVAYVHELRSCNFDAHNLSKNAISLSIGRHVWVITPYDTNLMHVNSLIN